MKFDRTSFVESITKDIEASRELGNRYARFSKRADDFNEKLNETIELLKIYQAAELALFRASSLLSEASSLARDDSRDFDKSIAEIPFRVSRQLESVSEKISDRSNTEAKAQQVD